MLCHRRRRLWERTAFNQGLWQTQHLIKGPKKSRRHLGRGLSRQQALSVQGPAAGPGLAFWRNKEARVAGAVSEEGRRRK